jgi:hypothetical protein
MDRDTVYAASEVCYIDFTDLCWILWVIDVKNINRRSCCVDDKYALIVLVMRHNFRCAIIEYTGLVLAEELH